MHIEPIEQNCSGCTACVYCCPHNAIKMKSNQHGFFIPVVDSNNCVYCGACIRVCPQQNIMEEKKADLKAYGFINMDESIRSLSTSGGFFPALARQFIENNGYVCGCILDDFKVIHVLTKDWSVIRRMQGSKYVQSNVGDCFFRIAALLKSGYSVLFTGTSCQVAGLRNYLSIKRINDNRVLYVDFFCHGVPSPLIWKEYIEYITSKKKVLSIINFVAKIMDGEKRH